MLPISLILPAGQVSVPPAILTIVIVATDWFALAIMPGVLQGAQRLLGLGDIIVPGINVALFRRIDKTNGLTAVRRPQSRNHRRDFRALSFMAVCLP